jgi:putative nucleotidyltransferase with HDIG domain
MSTGIGLHKHVIDITANIPPFPKAARRVLMMLRDPGVELIRVAEVVSLDQALAGRVLRLANSAYFGLPRRISSVTEALVLLGFVNVRSVLISASVGHILFDGAKSYGLERGVLWEHSVGAAYTAQMVTKKIDIRKYDVAFSAGLLHDIAKIVIDRSLRDEAKADLLRAINATGEIEAETEMLGANHAEIGGRICERWNLPAEIVEAVGFHHNPGGYEGTDRLPSIVAAANLCSKAVLGGTGMIDEELFASAPQGTFVPDALTLRKLSEDLPAIIASSKDLLEGTTEDITGSVQPTQK